MKKNVFYISLLGVIIVGLLLYFTLPEKSQQKQMLVPVKFGEFRITVTTTGELETENSQAINGPSGLRRFGIWRVEINDMVPDGTVVDSGEWVADLDKSELTSKKQDLESELEKLESQYTQTKLDTSMTLRQAREELINLEYAVEEQKIKLEQSKFEPPATQRQIKIDLERSKRELNQARESYNLKLEKAKADMQEVTASLNKTRRRYKKLQDIMDEFTVTAPEGGMVVYKRNSRGEKQGVGSQMSVWDNVVAELPDLSEMISKTYVNEVDISKVKEGQKAFIGIDAFPEKEYPGKVINVANIGQQMKNSNAKVFEVEIELEEEDEVLRPAMTTKNEIITEVYDSVRYVPLEALFHDEDISFVITQDNKRYEVKLGKSNENEIIIKRGISGNKKVYIKPPEDYETLELVRLKKK
ncbi:MAG: efflux RND transporter periplasmic adaptor subunit [Bacteroidales bacterium]|nr:efflux RND transporter periplasmic adaptor subunit [Bacteroidales bacterium]MCF8334495.1 efflux RND transporter periplasmic adaptor subunit [Bacteroidales bacterium]